MFRSLLQRSTSLRWILLFSWMALIFVMSADPESGEKSGFLIELLHTLFPGLSADILDTIHFVLRKAAHMTEYGILALLWLWALPGRYRLAFVFSLIYAITDEMHQALVPGRGPSATDVLIDGVGSGLALLLHAFLTNIKINR